MNDIKFIQLEKIINIFNERKIMRKKNRNQSNASYKNININVLNVKIYYEQEQKFKNYTKK